MKLIPRAKPVKIRIMAHGKEHNSLDSLRQDFCWADVKKVIANGSLEKWLKRLGEEAIAVDFRRRKGTEISIREAYNFLFIKKKNERFKSDREVFLAYGRGNDKHLLTPLVEELLKDLSCSELMRLSKELKGNDKIIREKVVSLSYYAKGNSSPQEVFEIGKFLFDSHKDHAIDLIKSASDRFNENAIEFISSHYSDFKHLLETTSISKNEYVRAYRELRQEIIKKWGKSKDLGILADGPHQEEILKFCNTCNLAFWKHLHDYNYRDASFLGTEFYISRSGPLKVLYDFIKGLLKSADPATKILRGISAYPPAKKMLTSPKNIYVNNNVYTFDNNKVKKSSIYLQIGACQQNCNELPKIIMNLEIFLQDVESN